MMKPVLISFDLCPFVQRSVITMKIKNVDFDVKYIDLENKPDWFLKISPFGKVPVLQIGEDVLFESAVINDYLDEMNPPSLYPQNALEKAKNRAWIEFGSELIMNMFQWSIANDLEAHDRTKQTYLENLEKLENHLNNTPYFNGESLSLVDAAYAPLFQRQILLDKAMNGEILNGYPKTKAWAHAVVALPEVTESVIPEFNETFLSYLRAKNSILGQQISTVSA